MRELNSNDLAFVSGGINGLSLVQHQVTRAMANPVIRQSVDRGVRMAANSGDVFGNLSSRRSFVPGSNGSIRVTSW